MPKKKAPKFNPKSTLVIIVTLLIGFFGGITYQGYQESQTEKLPDELIVTRIIDGDNVELSTGESVRLYGVNCPEKKQPFSKEAIDLTTKLALNQEIRIEYQPNYKKDRWDRILGYVFINDTHLNEELVRSGLCEVVIYEKRAKLIYQDELLEAQDQAKQQKLGKWE
jgi:micrococcal nuclease